MRCVFLIELLLLIVGINVTAANIERVVSSSKPNNIINLRIAQWNIGKLNMGRHGKTSIMKEEREENALLYSCFVNRLQADILCINEYAPFFSLDESKNENMNDSTRNVILSNYNQCFYGPRYGANCNCIASNIGIMDSIIVVDYKQKKQQRYFLACDIIIKGIKIKIISTHLDFGDYKEERSSQIKELIEYASDCQYSIICGDFNVVDVMEYEIFERNGYKLANHGFAGNLITCPTKTWGLSIDNIICKGFDISSVTVYKDRLSDHYAIACDVYMSIQ